MLIKARDLDIGDVIKLGGYRHTITVATQRGSHMVLTVANMRNSRTQTLTCDSGTSFTRIDPL